MYDAHKHMGLSMCLKTTDGKEKCLENINFVDDRESIQFLIDFLELKDCPGTNLFEKNILFDSLVVVCMSQNFLLSWPRAVPL